MQQNTDLDFEIAKTVFGVDEESQRWGVPLFSEDRNAAAIINTEMAFRKDGTKEKYEKALKNIARKRGWESSEEFNGMAILLMVLCPEEICMAAMTACLG